MTNDSASVAERGGAMDMFRHLFHTHSDRFPFFFNAALVFALAAVTWFRRGNFTLGLDESYYKN